MYYKTVDFGVVMFFFTTLCDLLIWLEMLTTNVINSKDCPTIQ